MKSVSFKFCFLISLIFSSLGFSHDNYDTHSLTLNGELSNDDSYEENFGRFDVYELNMQDGDLIKIELKANFFPLLTIVAPSGNHKIAFPADENPVVNFDFEINETGRWYIYVSGDSMDTGTHDLQLCYVAGNTRQLPYEADICTITKFLLAHTNTKYFFFRDNNCEIIENEWNVDLKNQNLFSNAEVKADGNSISFDLNTSSNESRNRFSEWSYKISECLTDEWIEKEGTNQTVFTESNGTRIIVIEFSNNTIHLRFHTSIKS